MTIEELKESGNIIFECVSGSRAYGLQTPTSDTDIRGVFILPQDQFYSLDYVGQVNNDSNDIVYYELKKFVELCAKNNPNILELLNVPEHCIKYKHPLFDSIKSSIFLSKRCELSFANYAFTQIRKARGLEKKIVNPVEKERKSPLKFCFVLEDGKSVELLKFLNQRSIKQENCGLGSIPHMKNCFNLFHHKDIPYKGIVKNTDSNEIATSHIPKGEEPMALMYFNKEGYSTYCKKYREYWDWVKKRNEDRYENTNAHGKKYDAKNMMHTFRLLHMAKEIALESKIMVERPDRAFLLDVKNGKYAFEYLVKQAQELREEIGVLFESAELPDEPDMNHINKLLASIRRDFYNFA